MTEITINRRKLQAINTRKKILDVSMKLIEEYGFDNVTIDSIITRSSVSVGAFYHYFGSKNEILIEIFKEIDDYYENVVNPNLKMKNSHEQICQFFGYYADFVMGKGLVFIKQLYTTNNKIFTQNERFMPSLLHKLIKEGQVRNEISNESSSEEIRDFLLMFVRGVVFNWCLHDGNFDLRQAVSNDVMRILRIFE